MSNLHLKHSATLCLSLLALTSTASAQEQSTSEVLARVRAAHETAVHTAVETDAGFEARNPGQDWTLSFDKRGFLAKPDASDWSWGLELMSYGFARNELVVSDSACASSEAERVAYEWDDTLEEWYVNDKRGLEHGFTVRERPLGGANENGPLTLTLQVRGGLTPQIQAGGRGIDFLDSTGSIAVTYSGLIVFDANGTDLDAGFELTSRGILLSIEEAQASYPLTIDPVAQEAYIKASNAGIIDAFGQEAAASGDTLIVGARFENSDSINVNGSQNDDLINSGAAYIFVRSGSTWTQQAFLKAPTQIGGHTFGFSVAIDGDLAVVGAPGPGGETGLAYVFRRTGTSWSPEQPLAASNAENYDSFGSAVAVSGDSIFVAASGEKSIATGINGDQSDNSALLAGAVYAFVHTGGVWTQQAYIKASNTGSQDWFGSEISASGDTLVVGAPREDSNAVGIGGNQTNNLAANSGAAYVFVRTGTTWSQQAYLKASNTSAFDDFGRTVAIDGDTLTIGAPGESNSATGVNGDQFNGIVNSSGAAYVFTRTGTTWTQEAYLKAFSQQVFSGFGESIAIGGEVVVVGAPFENNNASGINGNPNAGILAESGAVFVYRRTGITWEESAYLKASIPRTHMMYGDSVGVSGDVVVVGNPDDGSTAQGINGDPSAVGGFRTGAAYAYDLNAMLPMNVPGIDSCSGDGGDQLGCVNCPCTNNAAQGTIGGCLNSAATSARLFATGDTSVSLHHGAATDLRFSLAGSPATAFSILTSGAGLAPTNAANPCFGVSAGAQAMAFDGLRCAVMNVLRHGGRSADASGEIGINNNPWGGEFNPQAGIAVAGGGFVSGQTRYFQAIYRDDATLSCMRGLNTSQAIEIVFTP